VSRPIVDVANDSAGWDIPLAGDESVDESGESQDQHGCRLPHYGPACVTHRTSPSDQPPYQNLACSVSLIQSNANVRGFPVLIRDGGTFA
jgi:hypothetical protein